MYFPMQILVFLLIEFAIFYIVFVNISQFSFTKRELLIIVFTTLLLTLLSYNISINTVVFSIAVNAIFILVVTDIAYTKSRNIPLSLLYTITSSLVFLLSGTIINSIIGFMIEPHLWFIHGARTRSIALDSWKLFGLNEPIWAAFAYFISYQLGIEINRKLHALPEALIARFCLYAVAGAAISFPLFLTNMFFIQMIASQALVNMINAMLLSAYFLYLVFAIFAFANSFHKEDEILHNREMLKNLEIYTKSIEEAHTEVRQFQHDHRNILMSVYEHIENNDLDEIRSFFKEYVSSFEESSLALESALGKLSLIQIPEIKSILFQKLMHAQHLGITIHIEVSDVIDNVKFNRVNFTLSITSLTSM